ncbi:flagellar motor switch protein FliN/FliY [Ectothiorhodospira mobilis]|uniref:Flagellar motor switch protein FliN n=1 Tax=Ectothiorhodospira mobilis TaxID=195064 RepID=A0A1I4QHG8_ECTMO|nr:flagellar motor switch protein FliN [Ectothiorhodospira mobilis]SFM39562.1 flagellar motor switch protein FliN/FliY [Ectothiorhodospira mobilis]
MSEENEQDPNAESVDDVWAAALAEQAEAEEGSEDESTPASGGETIAQQAGEAAGDGAAEPAAAQDQKPDGATAAAQAAAEKDKSRMRGGGADESASALGASHVSKAEFEDLMDESNRTGDPDVNLDVILDVPVTISMEIGRTKIPIRNLLQLNQGSVVELDRLAGEPLDVMVNGTLVAHGEVVVVNEKFGIRLTDVISPAERVRKLK